MLNFFFEELNENKFLTADKMPDFKPEKSNNLRVIKSEIAHIDRLSRSLDEDIKICKMMCDNMLNVGYNLQGFVQEISSDPFGFLLLSDIQVNKYN